MKRLRPNWVNGQDETQTELDAEAEAEQGLEELADLFATELQELQQQAAPSSAPVSRRKKSRKQLVTVDFGSQDVGGHPTDHDSSVCEKADGGVDLVTPPWLQPKTPKTTPKDSSPTASEQQGPEHPSATRPAAAAAGFAGNQVPGAPTQHTRAPQHNLPTHRTPPAHVSATDQAGQEDVICDDSSDDFEQPSSCRRSGVAHGKQPSSSKQRPGSTRKTAATSAAHASTPGSAGGMGRTGRLLDALLGSTPMTDGGPHTQHQQQQQGHQQQMQYGHQQHQQQEGAYNSYVIPAGGDEWVPPKSRAQSTQGPASRHAAYGQDSMQQQQQKQQQQQPSSSFRPPGLLERQRQPAGGAFGAAQQQQGPYLNSCADHGSWAPPLGGGCTAAGVGGDDGEPWWMTVLPDFVPVEVLLQAQVNPRDGAPVFINYKSQFKDGGPAAAAPRGRKAAGASTATRQPKGRGRKGSAAAAAAAGGPAGFMSAAQWDQQGGSGGRGSKCRSRRSKKGKAGSGGSSSGGRKRQGWRTVGGKKVFVSGGSRLTGAQAWKAYKGYSGNT